MIHFAATTRSYVIDSSFSKERAVSLLLKHIDSTGFNTPAEQRVYTSFDYWFSRIQKESDYRRAFVYVNLNSGKTLVLVPLF